MDYTFNNNDIRDFFEYKNGVPAPIGILVYLHTHPLVIPNFLIQLSEMITKAGKIFEARKMTGYPIEELTRIAIVIGTELPTVSYSNAEEILMAMRDAYKLCKNFTEVPS